jgi:hypothetical protein
MAARRKAENRFTASGQRDAQIRADIDKDRLAFAAKTARLRALRLAKEFSDSDKEEKRAEGGGAAKLAIKPVREKRKGER